MIYITGDTHGEQARLLYPAAGEMKPEDALIVCGDFGFLFRDDAEENGFLDRLEQMPGTYCFVDGNHENFNAISRYPETEWNGGRVHAVRKNVLHLMRGQYFTIGGHTFFTFGGAYSIDRYMRQENVSYWPQEIPSDAEYRQAAANAGAHGMKADFILTHTAPREMVLRLGYRPDAHELELNGFLEYLMYEMDFKKWYCGHWHVDREMTDKFRFLWFDTVCIKEV